MKKIPLLQAVLLAFLALSLSAVTISDEPSKRDIILDADTGNEVDDLFAIARALIEPSWNVKALNATHWQTSQWSIPETMENSHRLNQMITGHLQVNVPLLRGGVARMFDWGDQAQHSAAAHNLVKEARKASKTQKLDVIALGALTNVGSALFIDPSIAENIRLYWLGSSYDFEKNILKRTDFNAVMDVQAFDLLLNSQVEMHVIPVNVAAKMKFDYKDTAKKLKGKHPFTDFLIARWDDHLDGGRQSRTLWDLALIQAMIHPEMATKKTVTTSRDSGSREIHFYSDIDAKKMKSEFYDSLFAFLKKK